MRPSTIQTLLNNFLFDCLAGGKFEAVQYHALESKSNVSRLSPVKRMPMLSNGGVLIQEYLRILEGGTYSAIFKDGSVIYIDSYYADDRLLDHRYYFIPFPFHTQVIADKPSDVPLYDWLTETDSVEGGELFFSRGSFRFDCVREPVVSTEPHPVSHLTFASGSCRLPLKGPLHPSAFLRFTFTNFFREFDETWHPYASQFRVDESEVTISAEERVQHHLSW